MARKPNYEFHKRRKELDRKAEKDEKLRRKREKAVSDRDQPAPDGESAAAPVAEDPPLPSDR